MKENITEQLIEKEDIKLTPITVSSTKTNYRFFTNKLKLFIILDIISLLIMIIFLIFSYKILFWIFFFITIILTILVIISFVLINKEKKNCG